MSKLNFFNAAQNLGQIPVGAPQFDEDELKQRYWKHSGVPPLHGRTVGKLLRDDSDDRQRRWWQALEMTRKAVEAGSIVALLGYRGTGKTQIAAQLIHDHCILKPTPATYLRASELFDRMRASYTDRTHSSAKLLERCKNHQLLVIDEAHEVSGSDFERRILTNIIDSRYGAMKPTLLISNEMREAFQESIGPSIADRIRERGEIILLEWGSFRQRTGLVHRIT